MYPTVSNRGGRRGRGRGRAGMINDRIGTRSLGAQPIQSAAVTQRGNSTGHVVIGNGGPPHVTPARQSRSRNNFGRPGGRGRGNNIPTVQPQPIESNTGRGRNPRGRFGGRGNNVAVATTTVVIQPQPQPGNSRGDGRRVVTVLPRHVPPAQNVHLGPGRQPSFSASGVASRSPSPIEPIVGGNCDPGTSTSIEMTSSSSSSPSRRNGNGNATNVTIPLDEPARPMVGTPICTRSRGRGRKVAVTGTKPQKPVATKRRAEESNIFHVPSPSIPRAAFRRLVREYGNRWKQDLRWEEEAFDALQEATEDYIIKIFGLTAAIADNSGRTIIQEKDFSLAKNIQIFLGLNIDHVNTSMFPRTGGMGGGG